tara:strand:+ start:2145 stop:2735 length:591 start_codon:yes stop_codon:yes gene_type:complete
MNISQIIKSNFNENNKVNQGCLLEVINDIENAVNILIKMLSNGGKLLTCGNGGSSGDAQHIASEFINRFELERQPLSAVSLNSDTAIITSIANDYSYRDIFAKQIKGIGKEDDILMPFTTSGNSSNILSAISMAKTLRIPIILITGNNGGKAMDYIDDNDCSIVIPSERTSRIQEMHLIIIHAICECLDKYFAKND